MKRFSLNRACWWGWVYFIRFCGLPFHLAPVILPQNEYRKLKEAAEKNDAVLVFNAGGFGNAPLSEAKDFMPILEGIRQTLQKAGFSTAIVPYFRTFSGFWGRTAGTREQLNVFKRTRYIQIRDLKSIAEEYPHKKFILVGFSVGGGLSAITLENLAAVPNIYGITVGCPGWFKTYSSEKSLVLNNSNQDPLCAGDVKTIAVHVFRSPFIWIGSRLKGEKLSMALSLQFPHHEYTWDSVEVRLPIERFLKERFENRRQFKVCSKE